MARLKDPKDGRFIDQGKETLRVKQRAIANANRNRTARMTRIQKGDPATMGAQYLASAWHFARAKYLEHKTLSDHYLARVHAITQRMEREGLTLNPNIVSEDASTAE